MVLQPSDQEEGPEDDQFAEEGASASAGVHPPADSSSLRPSDFELDETPMIDLEAVVEKKARRTKDTEHHSSASALVPPTLLPSPAEPVAEISPTPPPEPAIETRQIPPTPLPSPAEPAAEISILPPPEPVMPSPAEPVAEISISPPPELAMETRPAPAMAPEFRVADVARPDEFNALALSALEEATKKDEAAAPDDNCDSMSDVAVEKVGLPGALGLAANTDRTAPLSDDDPASASGKQQKQVPYIPWGIELTLPSAPQDKFAELMDKSL